MVRSSYEKEEVDVPDVRYRVTKLDESLLAGKSRNLKGEAARPATDGDDGCTLPPNQVCQQHCRRCFLSVTRHKCWPFRNAPNDDAA